MGAIREIFDRDPLTPDARARSKTTNRIGACQDAILLIAEQIGIEEALPPVAEAEEPTAETPDGEGPLMATVEIDNRGMIPSDNPEPDEGERTGEEPTQ